MPSSTSTAQDAAARGAPPSSSRTAAEHPRAAQPFAGGTFYQARWRRWDETPFAQEDPRADGAKPLRAAGIGRSETHVTESPPRAEQLIRAAQLAPHPTPTGRRTASQRPLRGLGVALRKLLGVPQRPSQRPPLRAGATPPSTESDRTVVSRSAAATHGRAIAAAHHQTEAELPTEPNAATRPTVRQSSLFAEPLPSMRERERTAAAELTSTEYAPAWPLWARAQFTAQAKTPTVAAESAGMHPKAEGDYGGWRAREAQAATQPGPALRPSQPPEQQQTDAYAMQRISDINPLDIAVKTELPVPEDRPLPEATYQARDWQRQRVAWKASKAKHLPLYFEDVPLERYGHSLGHLQPIWSAGQFYTQLLLLPYQMEIDPPLDSVYALGYARPGDPVPRLWYQFPISLRGTMSQVGFWASNIATLP